MCRAMGDHGVGFIEAAWEKKGKQGRVNVLTHCNAGWLATVDWGTALSPIFKAQEAGIPVHVWVVKPPTTQQFHQSTSADHRPLFQPVPVG